MKSSSSSQLRQKHHQNWLPRKEESVQKTHGLSAYTRIKLICLPQFHPTFYLSRKKSANMFEKLASSGQIGTPWWQCVECLRFCLFSFCTLTWQLDMATLQNMKCNEGQSKCYNVKSFCLKKHNLRIHVKIERCYGLSGGWCHKIVLLCNKMPLPSPRPAEKHANERILSQVRKGV